ncbi:hypothetical protein W97_09310 [Coniosporium apollinis CBS 100218]|uniref:Aprataxin-like protein n=1 Tax=Coniosporium apollinis (strain CBS 100218) TaxID=1168221 RepID=R7Z7B2_CONA1|nr:uncharacterized protein W97_09310 [Coniosporium apollinis CBS 100218]EON70042.1 hypothetical protein W97_09310 [Coniosporium apollinis CBS 100218]
MSSQQRPGEHGEDAITEEEMAGTTMPAPAAEPSKRPNAFTELMAPKKPKPPTHTTAAPKPHSRAPVFAGRDGLGAYTASPQSYGPDRIVYHNEHFVVINDLYPKSSVHLLLLSRNTRKQLLHPFDAFEDAAFLAACRAEAAKVKKLVAAELRRKHGAYSASEKARRDAMDANDPPDTDGLPAGRDWESEVKTGVHAHPSMDHLHVHVLARDMHSPCMRHRKHYNSFNTPFLVPLEDLPLAPNDVRRHARYLDEDLVCWRCGRNFGKSFAKLKEHLEGEFEAWRKE